jgi:hypothetical protein
MTHRQTGARKRLPLDEGVGDAQAAAQPPDLVLEQFPERFDELQVHPVGQAAHVVVALDDR